MEKSDWMTLRIRRGTREAFVAWRERLSMGLRDLPMGQFLELVAKHATLAEEDVKNFKPTSRKPGRPRRPDWTLSFPRDQQPLVP